MRNTYNLELFKVFFFVAQTGSITKASKLLDYPKSKVSKDLTKLENMLEHKLLNRTPRGVTMTEKGQIFYKNSKQSVETLLNCPDSLAVNSLDLKGHIKITAPEDLNELYLLEISHDFQQMHPKVKIEIYSTTDILSFQDTDIDFALRIGRLKDSSLIQKKMGQIQVKYMATKEYLRTHPKINTIEDLREHKVAIIKTLNSSSQHPLKDDSIYFSSNSMFLLKKLALQSNMIATLPTFYCEKEISHSKLNIILKDENFFEGPLYLLSRPNKFIPEHTKEFKKLVMERLAKKLQ